MFFDWDEQVAGWYESAGAYTGYNKKLSEILLGHMEKRGSLCDLGCGLGLTDFYMAESIGQVDCFDISQLGVDYINSRARRENRDNIRAYVADAASISGKWENVTALFHGDLENMPKYADYATDRLIIVTHGRSFGNISPKGHKVKKKATVESVGETLKNSGLSYELFEYELENGQPVKSIDDAIDYTIKFSVGDPDRETAREHIMERITETGRADFPYYLPNNKHFGVFVVKK